VKNRVVYTDIYKLGDPNKIKKMDGEMKDIMIFEEISSLEMKTMLLCLKRMKIVVPKFLKLKIYGDKKTILAINQSYYQFKDGNFNELFKFEYDTGQTTIFDYEKEEFASFSNSLVRTI
jgi:hypothetical protein